MELYVIKCGKDYVRVHEDRCSLCGLDKASVFPSDRLDAVKARVGYMQQQSRFAAAAIYKLTIKETPIGGMLPQADERQRK